MNPNPPHRFFLASSPRQFAHSLGTCARALAVAALLSIASSVAFAGVRDFVFYNFTGPDGATPNTLIHGPGGLYGTTAAGGASNDGTVFKLDPQQVLTTVYSFSGTDGSSPNSLIRAAGGTLYGTTISGGVSGQGTVFHLTLGGALTTLYTFSGNDGASPNSLIQASDGNFYGTTVAGGLYGCGTIFKITPAGVFTTLYAFDSTTGAQPAGALVQGTDGALYGATSAGGLDWGTLFRIDLAGNFTTLYVFGTGSDDGGEPVGALITDNAGNLYGTTTAPYGSVFKLTPAGVFTTMYTFSPAVDPSAGAGFATGLVAGFDGTFYGETTFGGANGFGTVFRITPDGTLTTLYALQNYDGLGATGMLIHNNKLFIAGPIYGGNGEGAINRFPLDPPTPQLVFYAEPNSIRFGESTTLQWYTSDAAVSCTGSGDFSTIEIFTVGAAAVTPPASGTYTYVMTCPGADGTVTKTVTLQVTN